MTVRNLGGWLESGRPPALAPDWRTTNESAKTSGRGGRAAVLCVKFCKGGHGYLGLCGLAEDGFLMLSEIVHVEVAVGFEPVFMGLDG